MKQNIWIAVMDCCLFWMNIHYFRYNLTHNMRATRHVQLDTYNVTCTTWRVQHDVSNKTVQHDTYNMMHTIWQVQHDVYRTMCSIWRVQHDMYNKMRTIWQVHVYNMKATKQSNDSMVMSISFLTSQVLVHSWLNVYFADW